jgi:streptogramin lyase
MARLVVALLALVGVVAIADAAPPPVLLASKLPGSVTVGTAFTLRLNVHGPGRVTVTASGPASRTFAARGTTSRRYASRIVLPAAGRWQLSARVRGRAYRLGSVLARRPSPVAQPVILSTPAGITTRPDGSLLVAEGGKNRIARIAPATGGVTAFAGRGGTGTSGDGGPATQADIGNLFGLVVSRAGDVYVTSDQRLRRIDPTGRITTVFVVPSEIGPVTVDGQGNVFFAIGSRIYRVDNASGAVDVYVGTGAQGGTGDGGPASAAQVNRPHGLLVSATDGALLVADTDNHRVRRIDAATRIITTVATAFDGPAGMCHGRNGEPYVTDFTTHTIKRLDPAGPVVLAGNGAKASSGDGRPATQASIDTPISCAVDGSGRLYVVEGGGTGTIRVIDSGGKISTLSRRGSRTSTGRGLRARAGSRVENALGARDAFWQLRVTRRSEYRGRCGGRLGGCGPGVPSPVRVLGCRCEPRCRPSL